MMGLAQSCAVVDGVLIIKKESGWTSHDVVAKIRHLLGGVKVGHAGTLDPAATGVLPLLIGRGTRIAEYLVEWDKEYRAVLRLGETTDTQDATGAVLARSTTDSVTPEAIHEAAGRFRGSIEQMPPMYSAVKVGGVPLYRSARAGKTVARDARTIVIHALDIEAIQGRDVTLRAVCSKGTYIRTLCADIGDALGVGGHMLSLERTRVGPLTIAQALTVDEVVTRHALGRLGDDLLSLDRALGRLEIAVVDEQTADRVKHGAPVPDSKILRWEGSDEAKRGALRPVRIHSTDGCLVAIGTCSEASGGPLNVQKVLVDQDV
ncbi:MAG: tRNA pseudouridine(55) synthase TruB [Nitrospira sp.]|nr:tRNA pseudouridine(55) synthase TruB [Nitrospira sp.]TKB73964.1 MAG: tRNA pseudouridine(55) synthase TruB [Nitrospira sp.]